MNQCFQISSMKSTDVAVCKPFYLHNSEVGYWLSKMFAVCCTSDVSELVSEEKQVIMLPLDNIHR